MAAFCELCQRYFNNEKDLQHHINNSRAHMGSAQLQSDVRNPMQSKLPSDTRQKQTVTSHASQVKHDHTKIKTKSSVGPKWTTIHESQQMMTLDILSAHCHSPKDLISNNFTTQPYNWLDHVDSRRCDRCKVHEKKIVPGKPCTFHPSKRNRWPLQNVKKPYKCCKMNGSRLGSNGCQSLPTHDFQLPIRSIRHKDFLETPQASDEPKFRAVVLDCEMAGVSGGGAGEPILMCVIEYVTGAVILNQLIYPKERITDMRSKIHGISIHTLDDAVLKGQALRGWEEARSELWKHIDANTIIVGHALEHDLDVLRIIHPRIVDSNILSKQEVGCSRHWGLQIMCSELVNIMIRQNEKNIHDCMEDVLATREVVLCCTQNKGRFKNWAEAKRIEEMRLQRERNEKRKLPRQAKKVDNKLKGKVQE